MCNGSQRWHNEAWSCVFRQINKSCLHVCITSCTKVCWSEFAFMTFSEQNIQSDKKFLCTWLSQYRKLQVIFKMSPASLQTFIDTPNCVLEDRVQYSTVHTSNVFCDGHLQIINCVGIVRIHWVFACFCTVIIRCTETFWSPCTNWKAVQEEARQ
jgi:hypothetical protein